MYSTLLRWFQVIPVLETTPEPLIPRFSGSHNAIVSRVTSKDAVLSGVTVASVIVQLNEIDVRLQHPRGNDYTNTT